VVAYAHLAKDRSAESVKRPAAPSSAVQQLRATVGSYRLIAEGMLAWSKHVIDARLDSGQVLQLAVYTVRPQAGPALADVLVFPGMNGLPRQVAGLDVADHPDRNVGLRLAQAGFAAHVVDYVPSAADSQRSDAIVALAGRLANSPLPAGPAIADTAAWWLNTSTECTSGRRAVAGHSLGAFIAALAAGAVSGPCDAILASGVVSLPWLLDSSGKASPLHQMPPNSSAEASFGALLARPSVRRVQVQYGSADTVFGQFALCAGAEEVARALGTRASVREFAMGHGTNAQAAIEFLKEGPRT
jgi:hypothetical protein